MLFTYVKKKKIFSCYLFEVCVTLLGIQKKRVEGSFQLSGVHNSTQLYIKGQVYLNAEKIRRPFQLLTTLVRSNIFVASILKKQESTELLKELIGFPTRAKGG